MDVAFVVNGKDPELPPKSLTESPGVAVLSGDVFGRGVQALFRNYRAGRDVGNGIAALTDDTGFLHAVRRLADTIFAASGATRILDASPTNAGVVDLIEAVYPDAALVATAADASALAEAWREPVSATPATTATPAPRLAAPVFVVGVPRSGTTWLQNMLLAHRGLAGPANETSMFVSLRALRDNARRPPAEGVAGWIELPDLLAAMRDFAASLFSQWLANNDASTRRLVEKTPMHAEHLPLIGELFPDASVIAIHRDGRDVVRSLLEMEAATDSVVVAATSWAEITRRVTDTLHTVRARDEQYEAMLRAPATRPGN